jgi:spore maturation protein CgeB
MAKPFSATPFLRQLFKAFHEIGNEVILVPYSGKPIQSEWWKCYPNPNLGKSEFLEKFLKKTKSFESNSNKLIPLLAQKFAKPKLEKLLKKIIIDEKDVSAIIFIAIPLNQITGLSNNLKKEFQIPVLFYDVDLPTSLPEHGGFTFNYYPGSDLSEFDSILVTSEGSISRLKELGAENIETVHIGIDPDEYKPIDIEKNIDFFFYGHNGQSRKNFVNMMITEPSKILDYNFVLGGRNYEMDLGNANFLTSKIDFSKWIEYSCRSKVNLNVVHELHAKTFATSTARPFELSALGCCIVSSPYDGLEKWFDTKKEILISNSTDECIEIYNFLMNNAEIRLKMGIAARERVLKEHTSSHRAKQIIQIIKKLNKR